MGNGGGGNTRVWHSLRTEGAFVLFHPRTSEFFRPTSVQLCTLRYFIWVLHTFPPPHSLSLHSSLELVSRVALERPPGALCSAWVGEAGDSPTLLCYLTTKIGFLQHWEGGMFAWKDTDFQFWGAGWGGEWRNSLFVRSFSSLECSTAPFELPVSPFAGS